MFRVLTAGESHGKGRSVIVEGVPAGLPLGEAYIRAQLARRQLGYGRGGRMQIEQDFAELLSGVRHGKTLGSPIAMFIRNKDWENWKEVMAVEPSENPGKPVTRLRPGHADLAGAMKYLQSDVRTILERASARETAARVAAGAVARRLLEEFGMAFHSHVLCIGGVWAQPKEPVNWEAVESSPVHCADPEAERGMMAAIDAAREAGDTVGGVVEVIAAGVPIGLGSHVQWDRKLDGRVAQALMSIPAVKAVSLGNGWEQANLRGSQVHDVILPVEQQGNGDSLSPSGPWRRRTNNAGGTEGGITNGMPLVGRFVVKPISTLEKPLPSVDLLTGEAVQAHYERSDVCQVPAAGVIGEAMVSMVLADALLEKLGGDHVEEMRRNYLGYLKTLGPRGRRE
ncbi:MAG: chorismate synthase [Chloroflexi bacterium]|nr:chorismate synthase [Chloroflexota bacterium]